MIRLIDDYVVTIDEYSFVLGRDTGRIDKRTKNKVIRPISYHHSLEKAVEACRREYIRNGLRDASLTLGEAVTAMRDMDAKFNRLLTKCMRGEQT